MNIKYTLPAAALLCLWLSLSVGPQSAAQDATPQKRSLAIPVTAAAASGKPAPSVECVVTVGPTVPVGALALSPDGKLLAVGGYQEVLLWDLAEPKLAKRIGSGQLGDVVHALAFTKDGRLLAVGDGVPRRSGAVKIYNVSAGELVVTFEEPLDVVYSLAFSADGTFLAAGGADPTVHVFGVGKLLAQSQADAAAEQLAKAQAQKKAADEALANVKNQVAAATTALQAAENVAGQAEAAAKAVGADAAKSEEEKKQAAAEATAKRTAADQAKAALTQAQQSEPPAQTQATAAAKKLTEAESQKKSADEALATVINQVAAATTAHQAAEKEAGQAEAAAKTVGEDAGKSEEEKKTATTEAAAQRKAADQAKAALARAQQNEKTVVATLTEHRDMVSGVSFSADSKFLSTASADGSALVWDTTTWKTTAAMRQLDSVLASAFSPDGQTLAVAVGGSKARAIRLRRKSDGRQMRSIGTSGALPLDLVWVAQGNRIFVPCSDNTVKAYNGGNGRLERTFTGHTDWVYCIALSADATRLASGSADGTVKLYNATDGTLLATLLQLSPRTDEWLIIAPQGYLATSSAGAIQWKTANVTTPPEKLTGLFQNTELLPKAIAGEKVAPLTIE